MRILFSAVGAYGHLIPLLPLAAAARDAGHEVTVATTERFHTMLREAGLTPVAAGGNVREAIAEAAASQDADGGREQVSSRAFGEILPRHAVADLGRVLQDGKPDMVVYEVLNPGAAMAAAAAGVAAVCHGIGRVSGGPAWQGMCRAWAATAAEFGVAAAAADPVFFGNHYLDVCPPSLQSAYLPDSARTLRLRPEGWRQPGGTPESVRRRDGNRPLIYLTFGTAFGGGLLRQTAAALSRLQADVLVAVGPAWEPSQDWNLPANVAVEPWVSQADVLDHADLVVSHGGSGTTLGCLANGIPHLVLPHGADQFSNAEAISRAGAGRQIAPDRRTPEAIAEAASELLADGDARARARDFAVEIASMPSAESTVKALVRLVGM